jgi:hypothetical protein
MPANVSTEHLKLVAKDHDFRVLDVLVDDASQARTRRRTKAMSDRTMEVLPSRDAVQHYGVYCSERRS